MSEINRIGLENPFIYHRLKKISKFPWLAYLNLILF